MDRQRYLNPMLGNGGIIWVENGEAGANAYPVGPGTSLALFDQNEKRFFIKSVDISGMPLPLREFKYEEVIRTKQEQTQPSNSYITKDQFDEFENAVLTKVDEMMQKYLNNKKNIGKDKGE